VAAEEVVPLLQLNYTAYSDSTFRVQISDASKSEYRVPIDLEGYAPSASPAFDYTLTDYPFAMTVVRKSDQATLLHIDSATMFRYH
jgi:hypothetical protein